MKKVIFVFLYVLLILLMTIMPTSASSKKLTIEEARDLIWESFIFTNQVRYSPTLNYNNIYTREGAQLAEHPYFEVIEFPGGSYNGMKEYAETIFSKEISEYSYTYSRYLPQGTPLFVIAEDGTFYGGRDEILQSAPFFLSLDGTAPGYVFPFVTLSTEEYNADKLLLKFVDSTENNATVKVCFRLGGETETYIHWADCNFVKEDGLWKISDGEYFDLLNGTYIASPSTSDPSFNLVFILPTVSVAALASAFYLMRRRRENAL